ncbi:hypothetical protein AB0F13_21815 [Streptomyces sp. NPDC026206]|uniref:hypothetical protein n=1 Tax=Streptomyces sp. NPDC026206 TaxID=3157089 RepID=UPI0033F56125
MTGRVGAAGQAAWSGSVRERAGRLREQAGRLRAAAEAVSAVDAEGTALRRQILAHADRAEHAARALERAADVLLGHEAVLAVLARRRREAGGAFQR